jgi:hypothetical protein
MKIELRTRKFKNGNRSLYLEYYEKGGERRTESLNLFLIPEKSDNDRRVNQATLNRALKIKAERILGVEREPEEDQLEVIPPGDSGTGWTNTKSISGTARSLLMRPARRCIRPSI